MIQNLNPVAFRSYGTVLPDRTGKNERAEWCHNLLLPVTLMQTGMYRACADTKIRCISGKSILSVSADGKLWQTFYLDKPVQLKPPVLFSLSPFMGDATVQLYTQKEPEQVDSCAVESHRVDPKFSIGGLYTVFYQEREPGFVFSGESHPMPELTYVDQGRLHSVAEGHDILLEQGELTLFGPNQWHMLYADMDVAPRYVTITFDLEGLDLTPLLNRRLTAPQQVVTLLQQILREQERMDAYSSDMIISHLRVMLMLLLREQESPSTGKLQASNAVHSENEIIRQAQQYVSTHIREKLTVPLLAAQVDVSPSYLTALFHKNLQISPGEYIRRIKLQESKQMIRENNMNFTEIAAALQYSTVHHFSRQFKDKFGITPTEYAKSVR